MISICSRQTVSCKFLFIEMLMILSCSGLPSSCPRSKCTPSTRSTHVHTRLPYLHMRTMHLSSHPSTSQPRPTPLFWIRSRKKPSCALITTSPCWSLPTRQLVRLWLPSIPSPCVLPTNRELYTLLLLKRLVIRSIGISVKNFLMLVS